MTSDFVCIRQTLLLCFCLCCWSIYIEAHLAVPSVAPLYSSTCASIHPFIHPFIHQSIHSFIHPIIYQSNYLTTVHQFVCSSPIHLSCKTETDLSPHHLQWLLQTWHCCRDGDKFQSGGRVVSSAPSCTYLDCALSDCCTWGHTAAEGWSSTWQPTDQPTPTKPLNNQNALVKVTISTATQVINYF